MEPRPDTWRGAGGGESAFPGRILPPPQGLPNPEGREERRLTAILDAGTRLGARTTAEEGDVVGAQGSRSIRSPSEARELFYPSTLISFLVLHSLFSSLVSRKGEMGGGIYSPARGLEAPETALAMLNLGCGSLFIRSLTVFFREPDWGEGAKLSSQNGSCPSSEADGPGRGVGGGEKGVEGKEGEG